MRASLFALALTLALASSAQAQDAPTLVAPSPLSPLVAEYPPGAHGEATVTLALTIDRSGAVRSARVLDGNEPFASAALAASSSFRFKPAEKGGTPVAAIIRAEIHFRQEVSETPAPAAPSPPPSVGAPTQPPSPGEPPIPIEVTVHGEALAPSVTSLTRAEVRLLPGAFGDPFRAVEVMPGVTPIASGIPYFFIRGAPPGNVGYFLDGIRVPILYHLGLGPSVVHPGLVDRVDLYSGGYPAPFGRYAGGIVAGETKGPTDAWHGEGNLRIVDAGAMVEAPFAGGRGSALVGGRYSYTALLLHVFAPQVTLDYWDYQTRVTYDITPKDRVTAFAFGSHDYWGNNNNGVTETLFDTMFHRLDLRYEHFFDRDTRVRQAITLGYDVTGLGEGQSVSDRMLASRTEVVHRVNDEAVLRFGADAVLDANEAHLSGASSDDKTLQSFDALFSTRTDLVMGLYADVAWQLSPRLELTPGLRLDFFGSGGKTALAVDPRLSARLAITKDVRLVQAHGIASQMPSFFLPGPGFQPSLGEGLQRSFQTSAGFEFDLPLEISATVTGFHNAFFDMTDPLGTQPHFVSTNGSISARDRLPSAFDTRTNGQAYGLEVSVKRRLTKKLGGFASYTLSRSTRTHNGVTYPSAVDRTHVANLALSYDFGRGFRAGARTLFYTGTPIVYSSTVTTDSQIENPDRLPPFFRLDARLEKRWSIGKTGWISVVLEMLNATLSKEVIGVDCGSSAFPGLGPPKNCKNQEIGPVTIPSIGLEGGF